MAHASPLVRSTAARFFDIVMHSVNEFLASTRCVPALVTLGSDPDISVRVATIPALGTIIETVTTRDILKVNMQLQSCLDDPAYREEHALHLELVATFTRVGPNAGQKFRDEYQIIPNVKYVLWVETLSSMLHENVPGEYGDQYL